MKNEFMNTGIETQNVIVIIKARKLNNIFGLISYTSSNDPESWQAFEINEQRYKIKDNYKLQLKPLNEGIENLAFYQSDFKQIIRSGDAFLCENKKLT